MIFRSQPGFEGWLAEELPLPSVIEHGAGWVRTNTAFSNEEIDQLCFAHDALLDETEIIGASVNELADKIVSYFFESSRQERFETTWQLSVETAGGMDGLGRRADAVLRTVEETLKKRMSRVAKLATGERRVVKGEFRGLFIYFPDFRRLFVSRRCFYLGQRRMADDPLAPSRSFLKVEEAYGVMGRSPVEGETVIDLGAAPGGWSYSAAKRGATVTAIDNGPMKGGALNHAKIEHLRDDAFRFTPAEGQEFDWLFCDLLEDPHHVLQNILQPWLERKWCRRFIVNLKLGRVDPLALLKELKQPDGLLAVYARDVRIRHLFHDREEFTIVGETHL